ncbi:hypothetical protein [Mesorhizobium sp. 113-3-9]|uniref:hypothetical protein n=1 Tax=Mesorhizobium sp. 113-3-9 TaxID=2744517 RepID=UPI001928540A|nr:hypothetical protein [Mesorhizobium sp. 113-3-9]
MQTERIRNQISKTKNFRNPILKKGLLAAFEASGRRFKNRLDSITRQPAPAEPFSRMAVLAVLGRDAAISTGALPSSQVISPEPGSTS